MLLKQFAHNNQLQLVGVDRPGYGLSTFTKRQRLKDFAPDVNALADYLQLRNFTVLSWSGGGPFALTYAALNPDRVACTVAVGCPALPFDPATAHDNSPLAKVAIKTPFLAKWALNIFRKSILSASQDIERYLESRSGKNMLASWPKPDARFFADPAWLKLMYTAIAEGFRQESNSVTTVYQEHSLFMKPWEIPLRHVPAGKLTLWQGAQDKTCPLGNEQRIAEIIRGARIEVFPDEGHCVMFAKPEKLAQALNPESRKDRR